MTRRESAGLVGDVVEVPRTNHGHLLATRDRWDAVHLVDYLVGVPLSTANATHVARDGDLMNVLYSPTTGYYVFVALGTNADVAVDGRPIDLRDLRQALRDSLEDLDD